MAVETLERVAAALRRRGFEAWCCATRAEAAAILRSFDQWRVNAVVTGK